MSAHVVAERVLKSLQASLPNDASIAVPHDDVVTVVVEAIALVGATTTVEAAKLFECFDSDKDGLLSFDEVSKLPFPLPAHRREKLTFLDFLRRFAKEMGKDTKVRKPSEEQLRADADGFLRTFASVKDSSGLEMLTRLDFKRLVQSVNDAFGW